MVNIAVYLTPALTDVKGRMWIEFGGTWYSLIDIPPSVNGIIGPFSFADGYPNNLHKIVFPAQTIGGVIYLETETAPFYTNTNQTLYVTLSPSGGPSIPTTLSIDAPGSVAPGEAFYISGILYETGTGVPIPGQIIHLSYQYPGEQRDLGNPITGIDGDYLRQASLPTAGTGNLLARFTGTLTLGASQANAIVAATPLEAAISIVSSAVTGLAMIIYSLS